MFVAHHNTTHTHTVLRVGFQALDVVVAGLDTLDFSASSASSASSAGSAKGKGEPLIAVDEYPMCLVMELGKCSLDEASAADADNRLPFRSRESGAELWIRSGAASSLRPPYAETAPTAHFE